MAIISRNLRTKYDHLTINNISDFYGFQLCLSTVPKNGPTQEEQFPGFIHCTIAIYYNID